MKERLKELRKTRPEWKSQESFAKFLGISVSNLASYETGRREPSSAVVQLICQKCDVNKDWLETGTGEMFVKKTRDEQIASFIGSIQSVEDDSFKKRFISMLSSLDESDWETLEKIAVSLHKKKD